MELKLYSKSGHLKAILDPSRGSKVPKMRPIRPIWKLRQGMEIRQDSWHRLPILLSFWLIVLIGIPFWWYTTLVYRAELPAEEIVALSISKPSLEFRFPVKLVLHLKDEQKKLDLPQFIEEEYLNEATDKNGSYFYKNLLRLNFETSSELQGKSFESIEHIAQFLESQGKKTEDYIFHAFEASAQPSVKSKTVFMSQSRLGVVIVDSFFSSEFIPTFQKLAAAALHLDQGAELVDTFYSLKLLPKYQITFNLLIADDRKMDWSIKEALNSYLKPFLLKISAISELAVDSQILHFSSLKVQPKKEKDFYYLEPSDLQHFVNAAEWNIEAPVISTQNVHLCAFIPEAANVPLFIRNNSMEIVKTNSFIFPQWGGVVIVNPTASQDILSSGQMENIMGMFLQHLRSLFGVPRISNRSFMGYEISYEEAAGGITELEFDLLMRDKTVKSLMGSISTLHSLVRLVDSIPNMVVPDEIDLAVRTSLTLISDSVDELTSGRRMAGYLKASKSLELSEKCFFDHKMVSMLYFPNDHKYAVYIPIFFPTLLPIIISTMKILKERMRLKRQASGISQ